MSQEFVNALTRGDFDKAESIYNREADKEGLLNTEYRVYIDFGDEDYVAPIYGHYMTALWALEKDHPQILSIINDVTDKKDKDALNKITPEKYLEFKESIKAGMIPLSSDPSASEIALLFYALAGTCTDAIHRNDITALKKLYKFTLELYQKQSTEEKKDEIAKCIMPTFLLSVKNSSIKTLETLLKWSPSDFIPDQIGGFILTALYEEEADKNDTKYIENFILKAFNNKFMLTFIKLLEVMDFDFSTPRKDGIDQNNYKCAALLKHLSDKINSGPLKIWVNNLFQATNQPVKNIVTDKAAAIDILLKSDKKLTDDNVMTLLASRLTNPEIKKLPAIYKLHYSSDFGKLGKEAVYNIFDLLYGDGIARIAFNLTEEVTGTESGLYNNEE